MFIDQSGPQTAENNSACWRQAQKEQRKRKPAEMEKEAGAMEKANWPIVLVFTGVWADQ